MASCHWRSSPGTKAAATFGGLNVSPLSVECVAVTPGAKVRLVAARLGILKLRGSGALTAISASPPPGATPGLVMLPTLLAQPLVRIPQLSGWPSYLNGTVRFPFGGPSAGTCGDQRHRSMPPGTPRMDTTN